MCQFEVKRKSEQKIKRQKRKLLKMENPLFH